MGTDGKSLQWFPNISSLWYFCYKDKDIVAKLQKWDGPPPHPNFGSDVKTDKAIYAPREYEDIYYPNDEAFWEDQGPTGLKMIWENKEG